jgi:hypothetical protein
MVLAVELEPKGADSRNEEEVGVGGTAEDDDVEEKEEEEMDEGGGRGRFSSELTRAHSSCR